MGHSILSERGLDEGGDHALLWVQLLLRRKGDIEGHDNLLDVGLNTPQMSSLRTKPMDKLD